MEWTFNTVAAEYDKWREAYVPELYEDIFSYKQVDTASNVLEIGIGTGQATMPVLETGCTLTAVEPGAELAEVCRKKFSEYPRFSIVTMPFEKYEGATESFDLIFSASAFHWVPEEIGYRKVFDLLNQGGVFARFANHPFYNKKGQEALFIDIQKVYSEYLPYSRPSSEYTDENAANRSNTAAKYGFLDISHKIYHRTLAYTSAEYIQRLSIQSDKIALEENKKPGFYNGIKAAIDGHGGIIYIFDTIELNLARKP